MLISVTVDVLCPKIVAKFYVYLLDFSHGIFWRLKSPYQNGIISIS